MAILKNNKTIPQCGTTYTGLVFMSIGINTHKCIFIIEKENFILLDIGVIYATDTCCYQEKGSASMTQ